jgi:hypothetical protein
MIPEGKNKWWIQSAAESHYISRAAALALGDGTLEYRLTHHRDLEPVKSREEVTFTDRELKYGKLLVSDTLIEQARVGFAEVLGRGAVTNTITPGAAETMSALIDTARAEQVVPLKAAQPVEASAHAPQSGAA